MAIQKKNNSLVNCQPVLSTTGTSQLSNTHSLKTSPTMSTLITCCAKLLKFDWLKAMQLIRNCTAENNTECLQKL